MHVGRTASVAMRRASTSRIVSAAVAEARPGDEDAAARAQELDERGQFRQRRVARGRRLGDLGDGFGDRQRDRRRRRLRAPAPILRRARRARVGNLGRQDSRADRSRRRCLRWSRRLLRGRPAPAPRRRPAPRPRARAPLPAPPATPTRRPLPLRLPRAPRWARLPRRDRAGSTASPPKHPEPARPLAGRTPSMESSLSMQPPAIQRKSNRWAGLPPVFMARRGVEHSRRSQDSAAVHSWLRNRGQSPRGIVRRRRGDPRRGILVPLPL